MPLPELLLLLMVESSAKCCTRAQVKGAKVSLLLLLTIATARLAQLSCARSLVTARWPKAPVLDGLLTDGAVKTAEKKWNIMAAVHE